MKKVADNGTTLEEQPADAIREGGLDIHWIEADLQRVFLNQGDTLILFSGTRLSDETRARMEALMHREFPGHRCLILEEGLRLGVVTEAGLR